jgi:hypothetical protein
MIPAFDFLGMQPTRRTPPFGGQAFVPGRKEWVPPGLPGDPRRLPIVHPTPQFGEGDGSVRGDGTAEALRGDSITVARSRPR